MRLKLADSLRAELFGIQSDDLTKGEAIEELRSRHPNWTDDQLMAHLVAAIDAGALLAISEAPGGEEHEH